MKWIGLAVAVVVFLVWMGLVGNPSELETVIGIVIAGVAGLGASRMLRR